MCPNPILFIVSLFAAHACGQSVYWANDQTIQRAALDGSERDTIITPRQPRGIALDARAGKIYWADDPAGRIVRADLDGANIEDVITGRAQPYWLVLEPTTRKIYWTELEPGGIYRANLDGSDIEMLYDMPANGLAIDIAAGQFYWTELSYDVIRRAQLDGSGIEDLVVQDLNRPLGIALDTTGGKMYWTANTPARVQRANLDGSEQQTLTESGSSATGIFLDVAAGRVYWCDTMGHKIQFSSLNGSDIGEVLLVPVDSPGMAVPDFDNGHLYWSDGAHGQINRGALSGGGAVAHLIDYAEVIRPVGVAVDRGNHAIFWSDGQLDRIMRADLDGTFPGSLVAKATAPGAVVMAADGTRLYWTEGGVAPGIRTVHLETGAVDDVVPTATAATGLTLDPRTHQLYWSESDNRIRRTQPGGLFVSEIVPAGPLAISGLAIDPLDRRLFWSERTTDTIQTSTANGNDIESLVTMLDDPTAVAINPVDRRLYWAECENAILVRPLDGRRDDIVVDLDFSDCPRSLVLDPLEPALLDTLPYHRAVDARQPSAIDGGRPQGWTHIEFRFSTSPAALSIDDWQIEVSRGQAPAIVDIQVEANRAVLSIDPSPPVGACTTFVYLPTATATTVGVLPGDVNGDRVVATNDLLALIDHLNGIGKKPLAEWQCDINRSGACDPLDILRLIDLMNGAEAYDPWLGQALPDCD